MSLVKLIIIAALVGGGGYTYYKKQQEAKVAAQGSEAASGSTFVALPPAEGHVPDTVVVLAPENCTRDEARRAEQLTRDLSSQGVRVVKTNNIGFANLQPGQVQQVNAVMSGPIPIVFVRGKAKANPTLDEVIAQYRDR